MMWISATVFFLVSEVWSLNPGTNQSTSVTSTTPDIRNLTFNSGSDLNLTCSDKTWNETIYVIWKIPHKDCEISFSNQDQRIDSCKDGKSLRNTSRARPYLHIPNLSAADEGVYDCDFVFFGGSENCQINVAITVPPSVSAWIEYSWGKTVAVCRAERGRPAANISWTHGRGSQSVETRVSGKLMTVESRLELDEGTDTQNLSCAVRHPYWEQEQILTAKLRKDPFPFLLTLTAVVSVVICVLLVGFAFFALKKIRMFRRCHQSEHPSSKSPPIEDVEEVEPYASYVQRVNSIYN